MAERSYVDRQQGCHCVAGGANLRMVTLGKAVQAVIGTALSLRGAVAANLLHDHHILDCSGASDISAELVPLPSYLRVNYPQYDMHVLPFADQSFELIVRFDTLEHIEHPVVALGECRGGCVSRDPS